MGEFLARQDGVGRHLNEVRLELPRVFQKLRTFVGKLLVRAGRPSLEARAGRPFNLRSALTVASKQLHCSNRRGAVPASRTRPIAVARHFTRFAMQLLDTRRQFLALRSEASS